MQLLRIALFLSLGLNLFIAGCWVGDTWRRPPIPGMPSPNASFLATMVKGRVSAATMDAIGPSLEVIDATFRAGFDARNAIFMQLRSAVAAEPYDAAAVNTLLSSLVTSRTQTETEQWKQVGATLSELPAGERLILAEIFFPLPSDRPSFEPRLPAPPWP